MPAAATDEATDQVGDQVTDQVGQLLRTLRGGFDGHGYHAAPWTTPPAIRLGQVAMTVPDKPNSRLQRYRLTLRGRVLLG
jgi:hypothetical protein